MEKDYLIPGSTEIICAQVRNYNTFLYPVLDYLLAKTTTMLWIKRYTIYKDGTSSSREKINKMVWRANFYRNRSKMSNPSDYYTQTKSIVIWWSWDFHEQVWKYSPESKRFEYSSYPIMAKNNFENNIKDKVLKIITETSSMGDNKTYAKCLNEIRRKSIEVDLRAWWNWPRRPNWARARSNINGNPFQQIKTNSNDGQLKIWLPQEE